MYVNQYITKRCKYYFKYYFKDVFIIYKNFGMGRPQGRNTAHGEILAKL